MNFSRLLWVPPGRDDSQTSECSTLPSLLASHEDQDEPSGSPAAGAGAAGLAPAPRLRVSASLPAQAKREVVTLRAVPDKERKRGYRLSARQRKKRLDYQAYESRVCNLTLDINTLRQQVRFLEERRDLYVTRLMLARQTYQSAALDLASSFVRVMQHDICGSSELVPDERDFFFARVHALLSHPSAGGCDGIPEFVIREWNICRQSFSHHTCDAVSSRILAVLDAQDEEDDGYEDTGENAQARKICGRDRGCVVETTLVMSAYLTLPTIAGLAPHALEDDKWLAWLLKQRVSWNVTKRLYLDSDALMVHQCGESDSLAVLGALFKTDSSSIAATAAAVLEAKLAAGASTAA